MSKTVAQIFAINPTTVVADTDLYYLVQSPYTPGTDAAITGASLKAAFGSGGTINPGLINQLAYYASAGSTLSGLATANNGVLITSGAGVPSISSTLPSAVQGNITLLGAQSQALNMNTHQINNLSAGVAPTDAANVGQLTAASSPLTTKGDLYTFTTVNARLPVGTINGQFLQVNSGTATGLAWSTATLPSTATNTGRILRADGTNWVQTTSTFADTYAASGVLYANGANNVAGLTTANNGLLVTSNTGVPSILAGPGTTGNMLISNAAAAPSFTTFTYPTTVGATGSVYISNGTNIVSSTSLWPNTIGASRKVVISNGTSNVYSTETYAVPGTSGNVMTSDGTNWTSSSTPVLGRLIGIQVFTASGSNTYTPSAGVSHAIVQLWGAGGGGGSSNSLTIFGSSGGAGAYAESYVSVSGAVTISIGTGGSGQAANNGTAGTAGGNTTYNTTTVVAAGGGFGALGVAGAGGTVAASTGTIRIAGGSGSSNAGTAPLIPHGGGSSPRNQPIAATLAAGAGAAPANSGGGGGAGKQDAAGGSGGSGYAIVYEYS